jgi:hypothetical protein
MNNHKPLRVGAAISLFLALMGCTSNRVPVTEAVYVNGPEVVVPDFSTIPFSLTQSVDDVGWKRWENKHVDADHQEVGGTVSELSTLPDYQNLVDIGRGAGTRLMTAWILQDFDTTNTICQQTKYNNDGAIMVPNASPLDAALAQQVMDRMKTSAAFVELGVHGISHEHYLSLTPAEAAAYDPALISNDPVWGLFLGTRAEFAHLQESTDPVAIQDPSVNDGYLAVAHPTWGWQSALNHLTCWDEIYRQYFPADQHGFPKSFVPPAHAFYFNQDNPVMTNQTTSDLLAQFGVKYVNGNRTVCFNSDQMIAMDPNPMLKSVSYLHRVDGTNYDYVNEVPWYGTYNASTTPSIPTTTKATSRLTSATCGMSTMRPMPSSRRRPSPSGPTTFWGSTTIPIASWRRTPPRATPSTTTTTTPPSAASTQAPTTSWTPRLCRTRHTLATSWACWC